MSSSEFDNSRPALPTSKSDSTFTRYDFLDGLRAVLALYVTVHHAWLTVADRDHATLSRYFFPLTFGHYAVCFFIIVSGFCLMLPTLKNGFVLSHGLGAFLQRRAWRILPPYYFALLLSLVLIYLFIHAKTGTRWDASLPVTPRDIGAHLVLVQNFVSGDTFKINHVFWSIAVEWQIYFVFPVLLLGWRALGAASTLLATIMISTFMEFGCARFFDLHASIHFIGLFALGMMAADYSFRPGQKIVPWKRAALLVLLAFCAFFYLDRHRHFVLADLAFGCVAASLMAFVSLRPHGWLHRFLDFRPLVFIGYFSYSLYLLHAPLLQLLWQYPLAPLQSHPNLMCMALIVLGVPLIVLASYLFHLCCERPFLQKKDVKIVHVK